MTGLVWGQILQNERKNAFLHNALDWIKFESSLTQGPYTYPQISIL